MGFFGRKADKQTVAPAWADTSIEDDRHDDPTELQTGDPDESAPAFGPVPGASPVKKKKGFSRPMLGGVGVAGVLVIGGLWMLMHTKPHHAPVLPPITQAPKTQAAHAPAALASAAKTPLSLAPAQPAPGPMTDPIDQARQMFLTASQNAVHVASVDKVQDNLYVVAYVVGDKSGQAWVDLSQKVVFIGSAVSADGRVLTPASALVSMGATEPGKTPDAPSAQMSIPSIDGGNIPMPVKNVLKDPGAGFWEGQKDAPEIWAFIDPDSEKSLFFYQRAKILIDQGKLRVFWIPVGIKDEGSMPRAAYIMAQVGPDRALKNNFDGYSATMKVGAAPDNIITIGMRHRIIQNNNLLTGLGQMTTPTTIACIGSNVQVFYGPSAITNILAGNQCDSNIKSLISK